MFSQIMFRKFCQQEFCVILQIFQILFFTQQSQTPFWDMYIQKKTPQTPPQNTPFPGLILKVGKMIYCVGKMNPMAHLGEMLEMFEKWVKLFYKWAKKNYSFLWRGNVRLPLTFITAQNLLGAGAKPISIKLLSTLCHLVSTCINFFQVGCLFQVTKVTLSSDSSRKLAFWLFKVQISDQSSQQTLLGRKALGSVSVHLSLYHASILKL